MDILGIGPLELLFVLLIALIVLGPKDMVKAGRTLGRFMRSIVTSPNWRTIQQASHEIRNLPTRLMREAGMEEAQKNLSNQTIGTNMGLDSINRNLKSINQDIEDISDWTTPSGPEEQEKASEDDPERSETSQPQEATAKSPTSAQSPDDD